jgi:hypothetical protein
MKFGDAKGPKERVHRRDMHQLALEMAARKANAGAPLKARCLK